MTNKVTKKDVQENMQDIIVKTEIEFGKPVTYVTVKMKNGFTVRESTTCVDPANYDEEVGKQICLEKIEDKIWMLLGYQLQEKIAKHNNGKEKQSEPSEEDCDGCPFQKDCHDSDEDKDGNSVFDKFLNFAKECVDNADADDDEVEDDDDNEEYVHLSVSMSPKAFNDLLDRVMLL